MPLSVTAAPGPSARAWPQLAAAVLMLAVFVLVGAAASASAHQTITVLRGDGSYATMWDAFPESGYAHDTVSACDEDSDGNRAYVRRIVGGSVLAAVYDPDGAGGSCGNAFINPTTLDSYNICVQTEGCGTPVYRREF